MAVMNTVPAAHPMVGRKNCSPRPTTRLSEAKRGASGIDAMVLFECAGVVVVLGDADHDGGSPVDVLTAEENT
jgi:hypothetical protein